MGAKKIRKLVLWSFAGSVVVLNAIAAMHAWKFTHFTPGAREKIDPRQLSFTGKLKAGLTGIDSPRPENVQKPSVPHETVYLQSNKKLECWLMRTDQAKGTVIIFHGYKGEKSSMLDKAGVFLQMGYNTLLVDFMGAGGSEGNQVTIGYKEAENVKTCYEYLLQQGEQNIYLFGTSMGAAAIMKCLHDNTAMHPKAMLIECPFGTMYETVAIRFRMAGAPSFPMSHLLVFWGGLENGFWAFDHNPVDYANSITAPTLLLYGERDDRVTRGEIDRVYASLSGPKKLKTFPDAGHENYLRKYRNEWVTEVENFLKETR